MKNRNNLQGDAGRAARKKALRAAAETRQTLHHPPVKNMAKGQFPTQIILILVAAARVSLLLSVRPQGFAAVWPLTGVFPSAILLSWHDGKLFQVAVLLGTDFASELLAGTRPLMSAVYSIALAGDTIPGSWLLIRFLGESIALTKIRHTFAFPMV